jgi:hypothetical protein
MLTNAEQGIVLSVDGQLGASLSPVTWKLPFGGSPMETVRRCPEVTRMGIINLVLIGLILITIPNRFTSAVQPTTDPTTEQPDEEVSATQPSDDISNTQPATLGGSEQEDVETEEPSTKPAESENPSTQPAETPSTQPAS